MRCAGLCAESLVGRNASAEYAELPMQSSNVDGKDNHDDLALRFILAVVVAITFYILVYGWLCWLKFNG
jgi:hypothetical protein